MFGELLESRARRARNRAGTVTSVIGHAAFIAFAVAATRAQLTAHDPAERIVALPVLAPEVRPAGPARPAPSRSPLGPAPRPAPSRVVFDVELPITGRVDLTVPVPGAHPWDDGITPMLGGIVGDAPGSEGDGGIPYASGVDKPAMALGDNPAPVYPDVLRRAGVRGEVMVEVVVDTSGAARMESLRVVSSTHPLLTEAVRTALDRARFLAAEAGGRRVPMWVRQSFVFEVR